MSQVFYNYANTATSTSTTAYGMPGTVRIIVAAPQPPPKCPDQLWIEGCCGRIWPAAIDPRECARVRKAFETLEFSPEHPWDPHLARKRYRSMARRLHPDVGGDSDAFKSLSAAYDDLKRKGFFGDSA